MEDEPLVAMNLSKSLAELGFSVVGPYSTLAKAAAAAVETEVDAALLDVNLSGETVYPVADILASRTFRSRSSPDTAQRPCPANTRMHRFCRSP